MMLRRGELDSTSAVWLERLGDEALPVLTGRALDKIPGVLTIGGAALLAVWWITHRREAVAAATRLAVVSARVSPSTPRS